MFQVKQKSLYSISHICDLAESSSHHRYYAFTWGDKTLDLTELMTDKMRFFYQYFQEDDLDQETWTPPKMSRYQMLSNFFT